MKTRINKSRVALAGMLSLATAALALALSAAPAFAMGFSTWRTSQHGLSVPAPSAGGGSVSWAGVVVVAAVLAATVALGVIGWRRDRRGLESRRRHDRHAVRIQTALDTHAGRRPFSSP
jgi:formate hydrogenlyase subunit 3/multisubunit Na+/H+ antiporter MnhD subunit